MYLETIETLRQAIDAAGPAGIPSGHLYAFVMAHIPITAYEHMIAMLVQAGRVARNGQVLTGVAVA